MKRTVGVKDKISDRAVRKVWKQLEHVELLRVERLTKGVYQKG